MRTFIAYALLLGLAGNTSFEAGSKVWVDGDSTVRSFTCSSTEFESDLSTNNTDDIASLVTTAKVVIPIAQLDCGNGKMNDHMRKALLAEKHPVIEFKLASYDVDAANATVKGTLTIAGTSKDISIPATVQLDNDVVRVKATTRIKMTDWGVKPPSLMLGTMKVKEDVTVGFDVALKR